MIYVSTEFILSVNDKNAKKIVQITFKLFEGNSSVLQMSIEKVGEM